MLQLHRYKHRSMSMKYDILTNLHSVLAGTTNIYHNWPSASQRSMNKQSFFHTTHVLQCAKLYCIVPLLPYYWPHFTYDLEFETQQRLNLLCKGRQTVLTFHQHFTDWPLRIAVIVPDQSIYKTHRFFQHFFPDSEPNYTTWRNTIQGICCATSYLNGLYHSNWEPLSQ